eukprot:g1826.t1
MVSSMFYDDIVVAVVDHIVERKWVKEETLDKVLRMPRKELNQALGRLFHDQLIQKFCTRCENEECSCRTTKKKRPIRRLDGSYTDTKKEEYPAYKIYYFNYDAFYTSVKCRLEFLREGLTAETLDQSNIIDYVCPKCKEGYNAMDLYDGKSLSQYCNRCEDKPELRAVQGGSILLESLKRKFKAQCKKLTSLLESLENETRANNHPTSTTHESEFRTLLQLKRRRIDLYDMTSEQRRARIIQDLAHEGKIRIEFSDEKVTDDSKVKVKKQQQIPLFLVQSTITKESDMTLLRSVLRSDRSKMSKKPDSGHPKMTREMEKYVQQYRDADPSLFPDVPECLTKDFNAGWRLWRRDFRRSKKEIEEDEGAASKTEPPAKKRARLSKKLQK